MEVMQEIYQTLKTLGMQWREKPHLTKVIGAGEEPNPKDAMDIYFVETRCRIRDVVVRMDLQLYQIDPMNYLVDFRNIGYYRASTDPGAPSSFTPATWRSSPSSSEYGLPLTPTETGDKNLTVDVSSPFLFMECACRLIVELAGG